MSALEDKVNGMKGFDYHVEDKNRRQDRSVETLLESNFFLFFFLSLSPLS